MCINLMKVVLVWIIGFTAPITLAESNAINLANLTALPLPSPPKDNNFLIYSNENSQLQDSHTTTDEKDIFYQQHHLIKNLIEKNNSSSKEIFELRALVEKIRLEENKNINYNQWTSILLACVAILVTVLGVIIGFISFVGYRNFQKTTKSTAKKIAEIEVNKRINEVAKLEIAKMINNGELKDQLESAVDVIVRRSPDTKLGQSFEQFPEIDEMEEDI